MSAISLSLSAGMLAQFHPTYLCSWLLGFSLVLKAEDLTNFLLLTPQLSWSVKHSVIVFVCLGTMK